MLEYDLFNAIEVETGAQVLWREYDLKSYSDDEVKTILQNASDIKQANHSTLCNFIDGWQTVETNKLIIIMEYTSGKSFKETLK